MKVRFQKEKKKTKNKLKMGENRADADANVLVMADESELPKSKRLRWLCRYPKNLWCKRRKPKPAKNGDGIAASSAGSVPHGYHSEYNPNGETSQHLYSMCAPDDSTSALVEAIIPLFLPIVCKVLSRKLVNGGFIIKNEVPVTSLDPDEKDLPIGPLEISIGKVFVVDRITMKEDVAKGKDFKWPEKERLDSLMQNNPGKGRKMLVLDFVDFEVSLQLGEGIELTFPSKIPLVGNLEVGSGGDIKNGWVMLGVKRLRVFFSTETLKCYIVFMARPTLTPYLQVNADRGNGDYLAIYIKEEGALDNIVESVLAGFGPRRIMEEKDDHEEKESQTLSDKIGIAIGNFISNIIQKSIPNLGYTNRPIVLDLSEKIGALINVAIGKPRTVKQVKAHMEKLQKELEMAIRAEVEDAIDAESERAENGSDGSDDGTAIQDEAKNAIAIETEVKRTVKFDGVKPAGAVRAVKDKQTRDNRDPLASSTVCRTGSMKGMEYA